MTKINSSPERNVENIRRKNLEDNQMFLKKLLMTDIRNDFLDSARSILRKDGSSQIKKKLSLQQQKVERATRYSAKVKSGEIGPFVPEWQRLIEEKKKEAEKKSLEKEQKKLENERKKQENEIKKQEILFEKELRKWENEQKKEEKEIEKQEILFRNELRKIERELKIEEKEKIRLAKQRPRGPSRWNLFYKNSNPYQRIFKPRHTKVGERIQQNSF